MWSNVRHATASRMASDAFSRSSSWSMNHRTISDASAGSVKVGSIGSSASPSPRGRLVFNDSAAVLYLKFGAAASATSFTVALPANGYYEFPQPCYAGVVHGAWASAAGSARTTQY